MCSGIFQRFLFLITCLWFAATLSKSKHVENASTYLKLVSTKRLYGRFAKSVASTFFKILYISSTFTNMTTPFILINLDLLQNPLDQCLFFFHVSFLKIKTTFFASFCISMLRMINLCFAFKNKNCSIFAVSITSTHSNWLIGQFDIRSSISIA